MNADAGQGPVLLTIPCLNEVGHIESAVLSALDAMRSRPGLIVVADGGSTDGTRAILERLAIEHDRVRIVDNERKFQSAALNLAVDQFGDGHAYLIRVDAHGGFEPGFVDALVAEAERVAADAVVVRMDTVGEAGTFQGAVAVAQNSRLGNGGARHRTVGSGGQWVEHGHHALIRVAAFREVGGYNPTFSHNEDAEFDVRLRQQGKSIWMTDRVRFHYFPRKSASALARQYFNFGRGRARTMLMHQEFNPRQLVVAAVVPAALMSTTRRWPLAVPFAGWIGACAIAGSVWSYRTRQPRNALASLALITMHLSWSTGFWTTIVESLAGRHWRSLRSETR